MRRIMRRAIAVFLIAVVTSVTPLSDAKPTIEAAENKDGKYISDIKLAMGTTSGEAAEEAAVFKKQGYNTLMKNTDPNTDDGKLCADLNEGTDTSILKEGPTSRCVYFCYKTTDDPSKAITDLAVMNMDGGYSIEDYCSLYTQYMDKKIKPFVENFVATLNEYRANLNDKSLPGHTRAVYIQKMLNKLIDDDTGMPMGDLLTNKTKFEMRETEYNKLSETDKKKHADIVTILSQANGQATLTLETLLTRASDASTDTWIDRLGDTTYEKLSESFRDENEDKDWGPKDLEEALDKEYEDNAKRLLGEYDSEKKRYMNWDSFREKALEYEEIQNNIENEIAKNTLKTGELTNDDKMQLLMEIDSEKDLKNVEKYLNDVNEVKNENAEQAINLQAITICDYLASIPYGEDGGTLLDFFEQESSEVSGKNIKKLYPIVDALSAGQIAGLDFLP